MYKFLIRPLLFRLKPETVHHFIVKALQISYKIPGVESIVSALFCVKHKALETKFAGLFFENPIGLAAGFDKDAHIFNEFASFGFGHIEIGTLTPRPQPGNDKPRLFRIPQDKALINRMGFNNQGVEAAVERLKNRRKKSIIGGNLGKNTATPNEQAVEDYVFVFEKLYDYVDYFVVNVSCPNVSNLGKLQDRSSLDNILSALQASRAKKDIRKPVLLKISPDLNCAQVDDAIDISVEKQLDGFVVSNTTITRDNLSIGPRQIENIGRGGLSGKPITDKSTEMIRYVASKTALPIIGVGGIMSEKDALDKIEAGATLIQIYTGFIYEGPSFVKRINKAILKKRLKQS